jgi:uncharacterized DUF497 family protein
MPARDFSPFIEYAGSGILMLAIIGVFAHGIIRIISTRKMKKKG